MKKRLFLILAVLPLLGAVISSCSKNDDTSWTEIPKKVEGSSAEFKVDGKPSTGSVEFTPRSATEGSIKLDKVISGYSLVEMDVAMVKQDDGSFNFSGSKEMTVAPVKSTADPVIVIISVTGNITLDGKATVAIKTEGAGLAIGTYTGATLVLQYSNVALTGKKVILDALSVTDVSIKMEDVIPGEKSSILSGLKLTNGVISGSATTEAKTTVVCEGSIKDNVLTLNLKDVKINDPQKWAGTYGLADYETSYFEYLGEPMQNWVTNSALYLNWKYSDKKYTYSDIWGGLLRFAGGAILPQVLKNIRLEADGNVCAEVVNKPKVTFDPNWMMSVFSGAFPEKDTITATFPTSGWEISPKNLAYWFEKNGQLYVKINIPAIMSKEMGESSNSEMGELMEVILNSSPAEIKSLVAGLGFNIDPIQEETIATLLSYAKDGFPLGVKQEAERSCIYLDKPLFDLLLKSRTTGEVDEYGDPAVTCDLMILWALLQEAGIVPADAAAIGFLLPSIVNDYQGATEFGLGLNLKK